MFGLSWEQIIIIVMVGLFLLGPERIPNAVSWVMSSLRRVRTMASGAQQEFSGTIGPELAELRKQVAELQSLKEFAELRQLRELHPKNILGKTLLGEEFSGGITGFLGLNGTANGATNGVVGQVPAASPAVAAPQPTDQATPGPDAPGATTQALGSVAAPVSPASAATTSSWGAPSSSWGARSLVPAAQHGVVGIPGRRPRAVEPAADATADPPAVPMGVAAGFDPDGT